MLEVAIQQQLIAMRMQVKALASESGATCDRRDKQNIMYMLPSHSRRRIVPVGIKC